MREEVEVTCAQRDTETTPKRIIIVITEDTILIVNLVSFYQLVGGEGEFLILTLTEFLKHHKVLFLA